ncbi:MAG: apolipoprotein N-acyltransferase [bacterium]|nr:apolipoprotein N-acyltransferase [bacterium]
MNFITKISKLKISFPRTLLLLILSVILYIFSFPNFLFGSKLPLLTHILAFLWPIPFFLGLEAMKKGKAFLYGFLAGLLINYGGFYWLIETLHKYGMIPLIQSFLIISIMVIYLGLYWGALAFFISLYKNLPQTFKIILYTSIFILLEYLKSHLVTGFTWLGIEYSQYLNLYFIQAADIFGPYFIAGVVFIIGYLLFLSFTTTVNRKYNIIAIISILVILNIYGVLRVNTLKPISNLSVGAIQPSLPAEIKDAPSKQDENLDLYLQQSQEIVNINKSVKLIVWPETALRRALRYDIERSSRIEEFSLKNNLALILGNEDYWYAGNTKDSLLLKNGAAFYNSGIGPEMYHKIHLVPFGEFIPLRNLWGPFKKYYEDMFDFSRGEERTVFRVNEFFKISVLVCYEIIFPEDVVKYVKNGANLLANVTNNVWYGVSAGPLQDVAFTVFRAVETRCPVVRSANNGISLIVSGKGKILKQIPLNEKNVIETDVDIYNIKTFYVRTPLLFPGLVILIFIAANLKIIFWNKKKK